MSLVEPSSQFRIEKYRAHAVITLTSGAAVMGHFFLAEASPDASGARARCRVAQFRIRLLSVRGRARGDGALQPGSHRQRRGVRRRSAARFGLRRGDGASRVHPAVERQAHSRICPRVSPGRPRSSQRLGAPRPSGSATSRRRTRRSSSTSITSFTCTRGLTMSTTASIDPPVPRDVHGRRVRPAPVRRLAADRPQGRAHAAARSVGAAAQRRRHRRRCSRRSCRSATAQEFSERHDTDFAYEIPDLARFRANAFVDRKGPGAVFRVIPTKILTAEQLGLSQHLLQLCHLNKGLVLVTGPTGSGKSTTLCAMIDYINRTRAGPHHHDRGSDRVRAPEPEVPDQPARGSYAHRLVQGCAPGSAPRGPGHRARRGAARSGDGSHRDRDRRDRAPRVRHASHHDRGFDRRSGDRSVPGGSPGADPDHAVGVAPGRGRAEPVPQDRRRARRRARSLDGDAGASAISSAKARRSRSRR